MADERRTIVDRLPWVEAEDVSDLWEWWMLDIDGVHAYVTNRHVEGWQVAGPGGIILDHLNEGEPYNTRDEAMRAGNRVAKVQVSHEIDLVMERLQEATKTLRELVLPL